MVVLKSPRDGANPFAPPKSALEIPPDGAKPRPTDSRIVVRTAGGLLFAYSILLAAPSFVWLWLSGGLAFGLVGSLLGIAVGLAGLSSGWRLVHGRRAGWPIWIFFVLHGAALMATVGVAT